MRLFQSHPTATGPRLVVEREGNDLATGWAYDPSGRAELRITIGGESLMVWPRTVARPDVNAAMGERDGALGFQIPVGAVAAALALLPTDTRPAAAITFADATHAIAPTPAASVASLRPAMVHDIWLPDRNHVRLRLAGGASDVVIAQIGAPLHRWTGSTVSREAIVTAPIAEPFQPILVAIVSEGIPSLATIAFPSLLRGGVHEAEGFAVAGASPAHLADYAFHIAAALATRPSRLSITPIAPCGSGIEPAADPDLVAFLKQHAIVGESDDPQALPLVGGMIPTLAALVGGGHGLLALTPPPDRSAWLVDKVSTPQIDALGPAPSTPTLQREPDSGRPLAIMHHAAAPADLETLLFPLAPGAEAQAAPTAHTTIDPTIVLCPEPTLADAFVPEGLPADALVYDARKGLPDSVRCGAGPVLFLNRAIALHDRRTAFALAAMVACEGVATAGCLIVREMAANDRTPADRIVAAGLAAGFAAVDTPWRAPLHPIAPWPMLFRDRYCAAANHPSCVMVNGATLAAHGHDLTRWDAADLLELMRRASAAGLSHAVTTWFSAFDRRSDPPPLPPATPLPAWPDRRATRLLRLS